MRILWVTLFALLGAACPAVARAGAEGAVLRQDISVTLFPEGHRLTGESRITFAAGTGRVALRLSPAARVDSVTVSGHKVPFSFAAAVLSLELPASHAAQTVDVSYRASFNDPVSQRPGAGEDPSYGVSAAITAQGTFLGDSAYWYPVPSRIPAARSIKVAAPAGTEAVSFGRRVSRGTQGGVTRSHWEEARPVGALSLCAGPYRVEDRKVGAIELHSYLYPDNAALASRYLVAAARYLSFYSDLFGPYPFEKFAVVENFFQTGYGFPSFTLLGGAVIRLPFIVDTSFPHEIAHSWWGNGIGVDPREGNWCEGLVTYLADYLLKERRSAAEGRDYREQLLIDYASLVKPGADFPLKDFESRSDPASRAIGYGKGAMVFHMVRTRIGDDAFFAALRQVAREHVYRTASWSDFVRAFSRSAGRDLGPFMNQWLVRPGGPRFRLQEVRSVREAGGWSVTGTLVQDSDPFRLTVPLRVETTGAALSAEVPSNAGRTPFRVFSPNEPKRLLLDPEAQVFRILSAGEIPATVNSIKGSGKLLGVVTENCRAGVDGFQDLLASLSQEGARVVREPELKRLDRSTVDLIFCGMPTDRSLFPRLPERIAMEPARFKVDGDSFAAPDGLLFLVLQRPDAPGRVAALFEPLSEGAARQYFPKITHYGKYGQLVFAGGANRRKGLVPAQEGAAAVRLGGVR